MAAFKSQVRWGAGEVTRCGADRAQESDCQREQVPKSELGEGWEHLSLALTREKGAIEAREAAEGHCQKAG